MIRHKHRDRLRWISIHVPFLPERIRTALYRAGRTAPAASTPAPVPSGQGTIDAPYRLHP